jgi:hypothetical protein
MYTKPTFHIPSLFLLTAMLVLSGCAPYFQTIPVREASPTPIVIGQSAGVDNPDVFVDPMVFQPALLKAVASGDTGKLQSWMTEPFFTGTWRAGLSEVSAAEALKSLYNEQLGPENNLALVKDADLKALMGGNDPLSIPSNDAGVTEAFLVSGWGKDGLDEAILFIARQAADDLKWRGWMQVQGGFSGARLGGIQPYQNDLHGYSLYLPKGYQVIEANADEVMLLAPGEGHPGTSRAAAFIFVEPANSRTTQQVVEAVKAEEGSGFNISIDPAMDIEGSQALVVKGRPGQDPNRQLFTVRGDKLYHITFVPDSPQAAGYPQMLDIYAMVINTFHFTK